MKPVEVNPDFIIDEQAKEISRLMQENIMLKAYVNQLKQEQQEAGQKYDDVKVEENVTVEGDDS